MPGLGHPRLASDQTTDCISNNSISSIGIDSRLAKSALACTTSLFSEDSIILVGDAFVLVAVEAGVGVSFEFVGAAVIAPD